MTYLKIFCIIFTLVFLIGFSKGYTDCSKYSYDDYLIRNVRVTASRGADSVLRMYLCYVGNRNDTLIRYSIDSNKLVDKAEWILLSNLKIRVNNDVTKNFVGKIGNVRSLFYTSAVVPIGGYLLAASSKSPSRFFKLFAKMGKEEEMAGGESKAVRYAITGILAAFSGYVSGYFVAEKAFEPEDDLDSAAKRLNDLEFWQTAKLRMWYSYISHLEGRFIKANEDSASTHFNRGKLMESFISLRIQKQVILRQIDSKVRRLGSLEFIGIYSHEKKFDALIKSKGKDFANVENSSSGWDYVIYSFTGLVVTMTLAFIIIWLLKVFKITNKYDEINDLIEDVLDN